MRFIGEFRIANIGGTLYLAIITGINDQGTHNESLVTNVVARILPSASDVKVLENPVKKILIETGGAPQWVIDAYVAKKKESSILDPDTIKYLINGRII